MPPKRSKSKLKKKKSEEKRALTPFEIALQNLGQVVREDEIEAEALEEGRQYEREDAKESPGWVMDMHYIKPDKKGGYILDKRPNKAPLPTSIYTKLANLAPQVGKVGYRHKNVIYRVDSAQIWEEGGKLPAGGEVTLDVDGLSDGSRERMFRVNLKRLPKI